MQPMYWVLQFIRWSLQAITQVLPRKITRTLVPVVGGGLIWLCQSRDFGAIQQALAPDKDTLIVITQAAQTA